MADELQQADELERRYVRDVYGRLAGHVSQARYKAWPKVRQFLCQLPQASLVADIGCGTGKYCSVGNGLIFVGCDVCEELLQTVKLQSADRCCSILVADNLALPFRDDSFDALISIAVVHHFSTATRRRRAIAELARVTRPGGRLMVCVWALEQAQRQFCAQDVLVPWDALDAVNQGDQSAAGKPTNQMARRLPANHRTTTREQRVIQGSVGIEPLEDDSAALPQTWAQTFGKLRDVVAAASPRFLRRRIIPSEDNDAPPPPPPPPPPPIPPALAAPSTRDDCLKPAENGWLATGIGRLSPRLGRRLAAYMNPISVPQEAINSKTVDQFAAEMTCSILADALNLSSGYHQMDIGQSIAMNDGAIETNSASQNDMTFYRYYHVFREGELNELISSVASLKIIDSYYDHANWCVIAEKI